MKGRDLGVVIDQEIRTSIEQGGQVLVCVRWTPPLFTCRYAPHFTPPACVAVPAPEDGTAGRPCWEDGSADRPRTPGAGPTAHDTIDLRPAPVAVPAPVGGPPAAPNPSGAGSGIGAAPLVKCSGCWRRSTDSAAIAACEARHERELVDS